MLVKMHLKRSLFLIAILSFSAGQVNAVENSQDTIRITVNGALPNILGWNGDHFTGAYRSEVDCIVKALPYSKRIHMVPIARVGKLMELGRTDLVLLLAPSEKRNEFGTFSNPFVISDNVLVTELVQVPDLEQAKLMQIATMRGSVFVDLIKRDLEANVVEVNDWYSGLEMLARGRVQGVYSAEIVLQREIDHKQLTSFRVLPVSKNNGDAYISRLYPKHDQLVGQFNRAVDNCINSF